MYNYPVQPQYRPIPQGLKGRMVSSIEEVKASPVDFDGTVFYFPDPANKRIYTKQINVDGTATMLMYELREMPTEKPPYVTRDEFEALVKQLFPQTPAAPVETPKPQEYKF